MGVFESIAAHCSDIVWAAGITRRIACRSGASTGCSGLCPLPNTSQALPNLPNSIARHIRLRCTTPRQAGVRSTAAHCLPPRAGVCGGGWLVLRSLYFMLKSADLFAKICQSEFSGRYDTFCNTQKRNITILSYCRIFRKLVR